MIIKPKNWDEFQHYKDRSPSWIKLHRNILDNYEFHLMQDASKALAMCLWLVASENLEGEIDANSTKLAFRLRMPKEKVENSLKELIDSGFFIVLQDASGVLAECLQDAPLEEKRREEIEKVCSKKRKTSKTTIPDSFTISEAVKTWADANGHSRLNERLAHFTNLSKAKAYEYADWDAAFRNAITDDWAKLGKPQPKQDSSKPFDVNAWAKNVAGIA